MINIVANFQPFSLNQCISVYSDGDIIDTISVSVDKVNEVIKGLKNKYSANEINLIGNSDYLSKFQKDLMTDFNNTDIKINIVSR